VLGLADRIAQGCRSSGVWLEHAIDRRRVLAREAQLAEEDVARFGARYGIQ